MERKARTRKEEKNNRQNGKAKREGDWAWSAADKSCEKLRKTVKTF